MAASLPEEDLYAVLRLEQGHLSTEAEIRKAYRKRALESHPDKRPGDEKAAEEFALVQKAYELLSDQKAKEAYDEVLRVKRARVERDQKRDSKRQKLVDELNAKEEAAKTQKTEEEIARQRLKAELERLRKKKAQSKTQPVFKTAAETKPAETPGESYGVSSDELSRTLKVSWTDEEGSQAYSASRLKSIFSEFGQVEDIVVRQGKKNKHSALVVMSSSDSAEEAIGNVCGDLSNPLTVILAKGSKNEKQTAHQTAPPVNHATPFHSKSERDSTIGSSFKDFESLTFMMMRQAVERERLVKELKEKEKREEEEEKKEMRNGENVRD